jgi:hypothetical protein
LAVGNRVMALKKPLFFGQATTLSGSRMQSPDPAVALRSNQQPLSEALRGVSA